MKKESIRGVKPINKIIIPLLILILLSVSVWGELATDVNYMNQLNERLERNKVEILQALKNYQNATMNSTSDSIDKNFGVLDTRIQDFNKAQKRDIAVVMIVGFIVGFALSQVIKLTIERSRRRSLIKKGMELEIVVEKLDKESQELSKKVQQLKVLDERYSKELKTLTKKPPFLSAQAIVLCILTFLVGVLVTYFLACKVIPGG